MKSKKGHLPLHMECFYEPLTEAQQGYYSREEKEFQEFSKRIESLVSNKTDLVVDKGEHVTYIEFTNGHSSNNPSASLGGTTSTVQSQPVNNLSTPTQQNSIIVQSPTQAASSNQYLVMDPRVGVIVTPTLMSKSSPAAPGSNSSVNASSPAVSTPPTAPLRSGPGPKSRVKPQLASSASTPSRLIVKKPQESTSIGGIVAGSKSKSKLLTVVDLTEDEVISNATDSKEVTINRIQGKTYPSLVVVARPHLHSKDFASNVVNSAREELDSKVKKVLMLGPSNFTEWLLQQGLLKCEQACLSHSTSESNPTKLKLGMYSDTAKFPFSGGYVWISECCPQQFVSVFSGSLFEGAPHPPTVILKLIYHWACHTSVQNVVQWVKVDNLYIKTLYTNLRAICTAALHNKYQKMGGNKKKIQVGVISLGTTTQDGVTRQVKVEVLGVLDMETKNIRIRAIEPVQEGEKNYKMRFMKILEPLQYWVDKDSIILTDYTVDRGTLINMGYATVLQVSAKDNAYMRYSNHVLMEYLRTIVPRMFQNTLSLLSRQIIQQFLDELVWRERWGSIPPLAFDTIIKHISEQTKLNTGDSLLNRLAKIAANPFKNWKYNRWAANCKIPSPEKAIKEKLEYSSFPPTIASTSSNEIIKIGSRESASKSRSSSPPPSAPLMKDEIILESYFYGTVQGDPDLQRPPSHPFHVKCCLCLEQFHNNVKLMDHLIRHSLNKSLSGEQKAMCKLCCKVMVSQASLRSHLAQSHKEGVATPNMCLICSVKMRDKPAFISHMARTHHELEMPYFCHICKFRTSIYDNMVSHFYEVHNEGDCGVCPYCFEIIVFIKDGKPILQNQFFYISHIQKHLLHSLVKKCGRCAQWFVNKNILDEHEIVSHISGKDVPGIVCFSGGENIRMQLPVGGPVSSFKDRSKTLPNSNSYSISHLPIIKVKNLPKKHNLKCGECEAKLSNSHYMAEYSCSTCKYKTCCQRAMAEHNNSKHHQYSLKFIHGRPVILDKPLYCPCSYSTIYGHKMAEHLSKQCGLTTCYTTQSGVEGIQSNTASFPPLVSLDGDEEMNWITAYAPKPNKHQELANEEPKTILNLLGLVRKPSTEEANQDVMDDEQPTSTKTEAMKTAEKPIRMVEDEVIEIMDYEENEDSGNKMAVDPSPSPEAMVLD